MDIKKLLFACFLFKKKPKDISQAGQDDTWVEAFGILYGTMKKEVYVHQPPGFVDPAHPNKVYKVIKALYGLHQASRAWYETLSSFLIENGFRRVKQQPDGIFISQDKSMIGSLMYLTASRSDIMFAVCACARFQVTPKASHLNAVKRIFRYLKHQPKLGLWFPRDSPFKLEAYSDSDYGGASLDRKSTTDILTKDLMSTRFNFLVQQILHNGDVFHSVNEVIESLSESFGWY
ncbi:uncharacterized mitochondrial protein-like protein [Tanacetum coccineum]|uniref:Uncharacterized mitochondrial protein-like protein n=1 Tax=Tanacetum coccineum TaxID=301880 RepID=A0ABQ5D4B1_9ASTR